MNAPLPKLALETVEIDTSDDPTWYRDAVIYQLNVKAFYDSNDDGIGDFKGVAAKLDYVKELGVNTIWLMPFYPSPLRDDGYDIAEYEDVHPHYGTLSDFKVMLDEAHKRGLRVITELSSTTPPAITPGSRLRAARRRARRSASSTSGATPTSSTRARASSSPTPRPPTGPGTRWPRPTTGTASSATSRT